MSVTLAARIERLEQRLDDMAERAQAYRDAMTHQMHELSTAVTVGERSHAEIAKKLDGLSAKVDSLLRQSHEHEGAAKSWAPYLDAAFKLAVGVGVAYIIFMFKLK